MSLTQYTGDTTIIADVGTTPKERGYDEDVFKSKFDEGLTNFVAWFNETHLAEVAAVAQEAWTDAALQNSWVNSSGYATAGFYKDNFGFVNFKGLIKSGTATAGTVLFTLPTGYRPSVNLLVPTVCKGASTAECAVLIINTSGNVTLGENAQNTWLSLENIRFGV